jgi:hypothetical protein
MGGLALLLMEETSLMPASGLCPHEGMFYPNAFRNIY